MPDSDAVRSRRKRLHAAGDHSQCGRRCDARVIPVAFPPSGAPGDGALDPRAALERLAQRLEDAHAADAADAAVARELRMTLQALGAGESAQDDAAAFLADFRSA
jgi:hypothetical protein